MTITTRVKVLIHVLYTKLYIVLHHLHLFSDCSASEIEWIDHVLQLSYKNKLWIAGVSRPGSDSEPACEWQGKLNFHSNKATVFLCVWLFSYANRKLSEYTVQKWKLLWICIYYWRASEASETLSGVTNGNRRYKYMYIYVYVRIYGMWDHTLVVLSRVT